MQVISFSKKFPLAQGTVTVPLGGSLENHIIQMEQDMMEVKLGSHPVSLLVPILEKIDAQSCSILNTFCTAFLTMDSLHTPKILQTFMFI